MDCAAAFEEIAMAQSAYQKEQTIQMVQRAIAHGTAGTTDTLPDIYRLPVQTYSPNSWQEEMDAIFRRLPLMLALSCELRQPGDYKALKVLNVPVLIVRGNDGKVRAFVNTCTHRGRAVTQTSDELGKSAGKDAKAGKMTYPALLGLEASKKEASRLTEKALASLSPLGERALPLRALAENLLRRTS
jgi:hypothetical protein